uniref:Uncharacterized protein n=1 Tax=Romanomermis culicivorax TaxID=13658 RepID=A0A915KF86_ROMCU
MTEYAGKKRTANKRRMEKVLSAMDATCRKVTDLDNKLSTFQELIKTDKTNLSNTIEEMIRLKEDTNSNISQHASPCAKLTSQLSKKREHAEMLMKEKSESIRKQFQSQLRNLESIISLDKTDQMNKTLRMYVDMMSFSAWLERALILCVELLLSYLTWVSVKMNDGLDSNKKYAAEETK